jgi:single-strand DNA-binding protein
MKDINEVRLLGTVANSPRINQTNSGKQVGNLSVVTVFEMGDKSYKTFHKCVGWGVMADSISKLQEGDRVYLSGRLSVDSYEKDGQKIYTTQISATNIAKIERGSEVSDTSHPKAEAGGPPVNFSDGSRPVAWPYIDRYHKLEWAKPNARGESHTSILNDSLCCCWIDPEIPGRGGFMWKLVDGEWQEHGEVPPA